jgi:copper ion binding protein
MTRFLFLASMFLLGVGTLTVPAGASQRSEEREDATKATFLITGLHCPPCTRTVESSLSRVKGIHSIKVDWRTKNARLEFDESVISAQQIAKEIAQTPHMMGRNMKYGGWLALKIDELKDATDGKAVKTTLGKIEGVKAVAVYLKQKAVGVQFEQKGNVTDRQLIDALTEAGYHARNL